VEANVTLVLVKSAIIGNSILVVQGALVLTKSSKHDTGG